MYLIMKKIIFSENLRVLRKSHKLTQKKLAEMLEIDQRTVSAWENGVCEPSFIMLAKLCDIFDETFDSILT